MKRREFHVIVPSAAVVLAVIVGSIVIAAEPARDAKPAPGGQPSGQPQQMQLPPGWTETDMKTCAEACTPGKMHELLAKGVGTWQGKNTMWMYPGADAIVSESTTTVTSILGGRYIKTQVTGEMPGMGPFNGEGINGFDNASQQFVATWIDNWTTDILTGTGELSSDGKTMTWRLEYTCPLTKKPQVIRQVETTTGANTKTLEMFTNDPKTGKEHKMMVIEMTRK
jgi:hypothetical protein